MSILRFLSWQTSLFKIITLLLISGIIELSNSTNNGFQDCSNLFNCGSIQNIGYPFYGGEPRNDGGGRPNHCGVPQFGLYCLNDQQTLIWIDKLQYLVLDIDVYVPKLTLVRRDIWTNICLTRSHNTSLPTFSTSRRYSRNLNIFYGCTSEVIREVQIQTNVTCSVGGGGDGVFFAAEFVSGVVGCKFSIVVPMALGAYNDLWDQKITLQSALKQGFDVEYNGALAACSACEASGGKCGSESDYDFVCFCPDKSYPFLCPKHRGKRHWVKMVIGVGISGIGIFTFLFICYYTYSFESNPFQFPRKTNDNQELEVLIKRFGSSNPRRYSYADIKKMTKSFKDELGKGGYGNVYKGYLSDGIPVAVKLLNINKGNGDEFVNEVASISRTSHVNVVSLLGFCLDGQNRALVYEFMSNGSLEKHIKIESNLQMGLEVLFKIAIGVARGLEYLHGGCNTRILHFDIKPHNILLDEDFCPKISDFGLAKLCNRKESFVSMLEARGTIGYIAPEVFSRNFGVVSYKSDVYSYGMMILEMVGARNKLSTAEMSNSNTTYFPDWLYQRITCNEEQNLQADAMTRDRELEMKMIVVGLWCIQTNPSHRPSMDKVINMLEGSLEGLVFPPKPFLYSPSISERASTERSFLAPTTLSSSLVTAVGSDYEPKVLCESSLKKFPQFFLGIGTDIMTNRLC